MIDFTKKLVSQKNEKKINPIEIYDTLDRKSETGPLRPTQRKILSTWFESKKNDKDLIIKLHTGEGKTLIGLLILLSKINESKGPALYVCPNIYLSTQVCSEAIKFGIPFCVIQDDNMLPNEFLRGERILITHVQKVFNGKSIFGIANDYTPVGCIILDDSHACIDSIKNSFTINIEKSHYLYDKIKSLFEYDIREQGEGSFYDLSLDFSNTILPIPYWSWFEKSSNVLEEISQCTGENFVKFAWPLLKDNIQNCQAFISSTKIEISPYFVPITKFGTFSKASQRILMSATTQEDTFFIKGLDFSIDAIMNPIIAPNQEWSGEKMILIPTLIAEELDRDYIVEKFASISKPNFGIVALTPSFKKAEFYKNFGAIVVDNDTNRIFEVVKNLKRSEISHTVVLVNRYDGIDLPDNACRILIIDSLPYFYSLCDQYEENCRINSDIVNIKIAQKIEQGLGRSVRGEKDYSAIVIIGSDLVKFMKSITTNKFFSNQTRKQIEIGLEIAGMAIDEIHKQPEETNNYKIIVDLIKQCLSRNDGWKQYYSTKMDEISATSANRSEIYTILEKEKKAEDEYALGNYEVACSIIQDLIDNKIQEETEKAWYLQIIARYMLHISKSDSNNLQVSAFKKNSQLLKPPTGISYKKIVYINEIRAKKIKQKINSFGNHNEFMLDFETLLSNLSFGSMAEIFERSLKEIGEILGFLSQRPDKEIRKGPDNLWCVDTNKYILIECKSEVDEKRKAINKHEAGQMEEHCAWFESEYGNAIVKRVLISPTKELSYEAYFSREVTIMRKNTLKKLKQNIKSFVSEFKKYEVNNVTEETISKWLLLHKLDIDSLFNDYTETPNKISQNIKEEM